MQALGQCGCLIPLELLRQAKDRQGWGTSGQTQSFRMSHRHLRALLGYNQPQLATCTL
jgi:hypothetical protein